jgi:hypothetical protein
MSTIVAIPSVRKLPVKGFTRAELAVVICECYAEEINRIFPRFLSQLTITSQESDQGIQLADSILQWCSGQAPFVLCVQRESGLGGVGTSLLNIVSFIENHTEERVGSAGMPWSNAETTYRYHWNACIGLFSVIKTLFLLKPLTCFRKEASSVP